MSEQQSPTLTRPGHRRPRQAVTTAVIGATAAAGGAQFWQGIEGRQRACPPPNPTDSSCEGLWPAVQFFIGVPVVLILIALLLHLLKVSWPVPVTLLAGLTVLAVFVLYAANVAGTPPAPTWLAALVGALSLAASALVFAPGGRYGGARRRLRTRKLKAQPGATFRESVAAPVPCWQGQKRARARRLQRGRARAGGTSRR